MVPVARFGGTPSSLRPIRPIFVQFVHPQLTTGRKGIGIEASCRENVILLKMSFLTQPYHRVSMPTGRPTFSAPNEAAEGQTTVKPA